MKLKGIIFAICLLFMGSFLFACEKQAIKLDTPTDLNIIDNVLSWAEVENSTGYSIYISTDNIATSTTTSYSLASLLPGRYNLRVKALGDENEYLESDWSTALPYEVELEQNEYTLIFDSNKPLTADKNITGTMASQIMEYDVEEKLNINTYALEGWTFIGWNTKADGTGHSVLDQEIVINLAEESIVLYAQWDKDPITSYIVIFNSNKPAGASGTVSGTMANQTMFYDEDQNLTKNTFVLTGWIFNGWNIKANGTGQSFVDQQNVINLTEESIILYAQWTEIPTLDKIVKFYGPNNTVIRQVSVVEGNVVQRPTDLETQTNYTFANWYTSANFSTVYDFNTTITNDVNIYGKWEFNGQGHYAYVGTYYVNIDFINFTITERNELLTLLEKQPARSYASGTWAPCENSARDPNNNNNVILIYNSASVPASSHLPDWNKEHVWPQNLMPTSIAGDQHNLFPCNPTINGNRGSLTFTDSSGEHGKVGSKYYPGDEWRGEVARTLMYMAYRYNLNLGTLIDPATALKWHEADPVTKWEMDRNNILFSTSGYQNNRNPFVDHPELTHIMYGTTAASLSLEGNENIFIIGLMVSVLNYEYIPVENKSNIVRI